MKYSKRLIMILVGMFLAVGYQNCSNVEFGSNSPSTGEKAAGATDLVVAEPEEPVVTPEEPPIPVTDPTLKFACSFDQLADIRVNIIDAYVGQTKVSIGTGIRSLMEMAKGFNILLTTAASSNQVRLVLADTNNQIVDATGQSYALKTPSGQQSGIKINLNSASGTFEGNTAYTVKFELDPDFQIVRAGKKCLLKPVLHATSVTKFEF